MILQSVVASVFSALLLAEAFAFSSEVGDARELSELEIWAALRARTSADAHDAIESAQSARIAGAECEAEIGSKRPGVSCLDYAMASSRLRGKRTPVSEVRVDEARADAACADAASRSPAVALASLERALIRAPHGSRCRQALLERRKDVLYMNPSLNPDETVQSLVRDSEPSL